MIRSRIRTALRLFAILSTLLIVSPQVQAAESKEPDVRLALVNIPDDIVSPLLADFQAQTGLRAEIVYTGNDPFAEARTGRADLVIAHYGHEGTEPFVSEGFGLWPRPVFANQMALFGPPADPAKIWGLNDAAEAFRRIAAKKANFMVNGSPAARYLEEVLWASAGIKPTGDWYMKTNAHGKRAFNAASQQGAYVLWGLPPYLRYKQQQELHIEPLVMGDPLFQRIMVAIVVNPAKVKGVNQTGALEFENYLLAPATQARIRNFRYPGIPQQVWWPAGRHNSARD